MDVYPWIERKPLSSCEPGALLRFDWGEQVYGMLGRYDGGMVLVFLSGGRDSPPRYGRLPEQDKDAPVLSYGSSWRLEIDQEPENVDLEAHRLHGLNGGLILVDTRLLMHIEPLSGTAQMAHILLDIAAGTLAEPPRAPAAIFAKWSIGVPMGGDRFLTLVNFVPPKKG